MDNQKAKQTAFDGVTYRSKKEAAFAVLLSELGADFTYEADCYRLPGASEGGEDIWYRPDFMVRDTYIAKGGVNKDLFVEVKGDIKPDDVMKIRGLFLYGQDNAGAVSNSPVLVAGTTLPKMSDSTGFGMGTLLSFFGNSATRGDTASGISWFSHQQIDGSADPAFLAATHGGGIGVFGLDNMNDFLLIDVDKTVAAYAKAADPGDILTCPSYLRAYGTCECDDFTGGVLNFVVNDAWRVHNSYGASAPTSYVKLSLQTENPDMVIVEYLGDASSNPKKRLEGFLACTNLDKHGWFNHVIGSCGTALFAPCSRMDRWCKRTRIMVDCYLSVPTAAPYSTAASRAVEVPVDDDLIAVCRAAGYAEGHEKECLSAIVRAAASVLMQEDE